MPAPQIANAAPVHRVLQQELVVMEQILTLTDAITDALMRQDIVLLQQLVAEKHRCILNGTRLDQERLAAAKSLAWAAGVPPTSSLWQVCQVLPKSARNALLALRSRMLNVHYRLQQAEDRNKVLLANAIHLTRFHIDLLTNAALHPAAYGTNLTRVANPAFYVDNKV